MSSTTKSRSGTRCPGCSGRSTWSARPGIAARRFSMRCRSPRSGASSSTSGWPVSAGQPCFRRCCGADATCPSSSSPGMPSPDCRRSAQARCLRLRGKAVQRSPDRRDRAHRAGPPPLPSVRSRRTGRYVQTRLAALTARERQVMELLLQGQMNKQIAGKLELAMRTSSAPLQHPSEVRRAQRDRTCGIVAGWTGRRSGKRRRGARSAAGSAPCASGHPGKSQGCRP